MVEVFSQLMGQMTSTNKEIIRMHKEMKELTSSEPSILGKVQNDESGEIIEFEGSPDELLELELGDEV